MWEWAALKFSKDKLKKNQEVALRRRNRSEDGGGSETEVHYLINLTAAAWNARSDGSAFMLRAGAIYHHERRLTLPLSTPLTFINGSLKDSPPLLVTHTHKHRHTKIYDWVGKLWRGGRVLTTTPEAFDNLIYSRHSSREPDAID